MTIVVMGVTGSGKTTIGERLAQRLEWVFVDADDFHSAENKAKMSAGTPLTDEDRAPWLTLLNNQLQDWEDAGINGVLACSALKQAYRERLAAELDAYALRFAWLDVPRTLLEERIHARSHAFVDPSLLGSQLETLEPPEDALRVPMVAGTGEPVTVDAAVDQILSGFHLTPAQD